MKVYVSWDELYPVYTFHDEPHESRVELDIPEETVQKWRQIGKAFEKMQEEIKKLMKED